MLKLNSEDKRKMLGLMGKKIGMTQVFDEDGRLIPVTVVKAEPNIILGERNEKRNGYNAVILGAFHVKKDRLSKPILGQFKEDTEPTRAIFEIRDYEGECKIGEKIGPEIFEGIRFVDVRSQSKGKGYQGVMKRHGFRGGRKTHGSKFHRAPGSTGMAAWPARVFKGSKMPGRMGARRTTIQNLRLVRIDKEKGLLLIKGSIPGRRDSLVVVKKSKKR